MVKEAKYLSDINAHCAICGQGYHVCNSCLEVREFTPWRSVVDTIEHFLIYTTIFRYRKTGNIENAKDELSKCDLQGYENFLPEIKAAIDEILNASSTISTNKSKKRSNSKQSKKDDDLTVNNNSVDETVVEENEVKEEKVEVTIDPNENEVDCE